MQRITLLMLLLLTTQAYAYECKSRELDLNEKLSKVEAVAELKKMKRELVFQGFLFEITERKIRPESSKAKLLSHFLRQTEANTDQKNFIELLTFSSEIDSGKIKTLDLKEVCELNKKIPVKKSKN